MTKRELLQVLDEIGVRPSRRLGQNFLTDSNLLEAIVRTAAPLAGERILEVGAGTGVLTRKLLEAGCRVTSIELDHRLCSYLRHAFADEAGFELVEGDACKLDLDTVMGGEPFRIIANLPYACSSVLIANITRLTVLPSELFILLQKEMAARLSATSGTKEYGALSVVVQLVFGVERLRKIPPEVFTPPPEIESTLVKLTRRPDAVSQACRRDLARLVRIGFGQRRKKLFRLLVSQFGTNAVRQSFENLGLAENIRAEALDIEAFVKLAACLFEKPPPYSS